MNLSALLAPLRGQSTYQRLLDQLLEQTSPDEALEIPKAVRPMLVSALYEDLQQPITVFQIRILFFMNCHPGVNPLEMSVPLHSLS
jgi:hypothetical protein